MLFPFIAGLITGTAAVSLYRNQKTRDSLKGAKEKLKEKSVQAQETLRHAAVSGLHTVESSSARLRDRLQVAEMAASTTGEKKAPVRKAAPRTRKRAVAKPAVTAKKAGS